MGGGPETGKPIEVAYSLIDNQCLRGNGSAWAQDQNDNCDCNTGKTADQLTVYHHGQEC